MFVIVRFKESLTLTSIEYEDDDDDSKDDKEENRETMEINVYALIRTSAREMKNNEVNEKICEKFLDLIIEKLRKNVDESASRFIILGNKEETVFESKQLAKYIKLYNINDKEGNYISDFNSLDTK